MATQIVISNGDYISIDDSFRIPWADKGKNWVDAWCPNTIHYVIWNNLPGQNEIQTKDPATGMMAGNTDLSATSDAVGSTTIADLLTWAETRKTQITTAQTDFNNAYTAAETSWVNDGNSKDDFKSDNSDTNSYWDWSKSWSDYDPNYS
tara:strand:+ start:600 stop:1046 length:447 start_codon:yes stop_codon:yes gene_type:complete